MKDYRSPDQFFVKVISPKGKSIRWVKSVSTKKIEYVKNPKSAGLMRRMDIRLIRIHLGHGYSYQKINPNIYIPATKGIEEIIRDANLGAQSDFFE